MNLKEKLQAHAEREAEKIALAQTSDPGATTMRMIRRDAAYAGAQSLEPLLLQLAEALEGVRGATPGEWYVAGVPQNPTETRQFIRSRDESERGSTDHGIAECWGGTGPRSWDARAIVKLVNASRKALSALEAALTREEKR